MALQGDLDSFALPDVLRLLAGAAKTGRLAVTGSAGHGEVWLDAGELVGGGVTTAPRAESTEDVVFELLRFTNGSFVYDDGERLVEAGARVAVDDALGRAESLLGEWAEVETVVPTMDAWATLSPDLEGDGVHVDADRWRVLAAIGGGRSAAALAEDLGVGDLSVCQRLKGLVELGVVAVGTARAPETGDEQDTSTAHDHDVVETDAVSDLALLSADSGPVVLESGADALLPEPLPGAGTSYADDDSPSGIVDGRGDLDAGGPTTDPADVDAAPAAAGGWGSFDPDELADARSERLSAASETWNEGWNATPDEAPGPVTAPEREPEPEPGVPVADGDETDRGSLLKFLSSVKP